MTELLSTIVDFVWGLPLVIFLFVANIILLWHSRFLPLFGIVHAVKLLSKKEDKAIEGQISHFQTFCNAIAATVGLGNISGVAVAISQGGPGAIVWMWIAGLIGMNTKFFECTSALIYRGHDYQNQVQGGAMYTIPRILPKSLHFLAWIFAFCGMIGTLSMFQINQLGVFLETGYGVTKWVTGAIFGVLTFWVLMGGLKRLSNACSAIVPVMSVLYILTCLFILLKHVEFLPQVITDIFRHAFSAHSALYGTMSYGLIHIMVTGIKRATFSNEAGLGTAPMAHSNSKTDEPVSEGYVAMLGPLLDTMIVCTLTALVIMISFVDTGFPKVSGIELSMAAFEYQLGSIGKHLLGFCILLFGYSTILGMANYNKKCFDYLWRGRLGDRTFYAWYIGTILVGAILAMENVINLIDIAYALMTVPNILVTLWSAPEVARRLRAYKMGES